MRPAMWLTGGGEIRQTADVFHAAERGPAIVNAPCHGRRQRPDARLGFVLPALVALLAVSTPAWGLAVAPTVIDPEVRRDLHRGPARVLVELRVPGGLTPEGDLPGSAAVATQRGAIAAAQSTVLTRLAGTQFSVLRRYEAVPFLLLEIHGDALAELERMGDVVARVRVDSRKAPMTPGARP